MTRIGKRFAALAEARRKAFVAFVMAGDPDYDTALAILRGLPAAGVDVVELGMPAKPRNRSSPSSAASARRRIRPKPGRRCEGRRGIKRPFTTVVQTPSMVEYKPALAWIEATAAASPAELVALVLAPTASFAAVVALGIWLWPRSPRVRQPCRWKRNSLRPGTRLERWFCSACGTEAYAMQGSPPRECKRTLRPPAL